jgi:conjugative relaxase-like TrwC/TraI family protein
MPCSPGPAARHQALNVRGLVAAAFTHRDSRAGDPDLHTHVAVANKVQTLDGRWLAVDGRVLLKANVAASETYNTALEQHLRDTLGVRFAERRGTDPTKRPIREIVGVDPRLNQRWSTRRAHIETRSGEHPDVQAMLDAGTAFSAWWSVVGPERPPLGVIEGGKNAG